MWAGIAAIRPGGRLTDISHAVETSARASGRDNGVKYGIVMDYGGHGIGSEMHMEPFLPNYGKPGKGPRLVAGMAIAIEPMLTLGGHRTEELDDGWTVVTLDGSRAAHWEHSVAVTDDGPWVLTEGEDAGNRLGIMPPSDEGPWFSSTNGWFVWRSRRLSVKVEAMRLAIKSSRTRIWAVALALVAINAGVATYVLADKGGDQLDLDVYRHGALAWSAGYDLYGPLPGMWLPFIYPPIAAILFRPVAALPIDLAELVNCWCRWRWSRSCSCWRPDGCRRPSFGGWAGGRCWSASRCRSRCGSSPFRKRWDSAR